MTSWKTAAMLVILLVMVMLSGLVWMGQSSVQTDEVDAQSGGIRTVCTGRAYEQIPQIVDPERRRQQLGSEADDTLVDITAFAGMSEHYSGAEYKYLESTFSTINAVPITRRRYYHEARERDPTREGTPYPDSINPIYDRDVVVPLVILPRPDAVRRWSTSTVARSIGWYSMDDAIKKRGSVYGRTLIFKPGKKSKNPIAVPASPFQTGIPSWDLYVPEHDRSFFLELGKIVVFPDYNPYKGVAPIDRSFNLHVGETDGAKLLGEFDTVPAYFNNSRLRWASVQDGSRAHRFLAYSLLDGNGAKRGSRFSESSSGPISPYVRPLICDLRQPKIEQHDELLLPTPLAWPPTERDQLGLKLDATPHEEWCLDDWFPAQKDACWVIREAEDSKPLQESFLLMPASEKSDRPVFFIALFAETEPKQLVKELAALYKVSADTALNSPETMERLNSLYEKVRDFPLSK